MKARFGFLTAWVLPFVFACSAHAGVVTGSGFLVNQEVDWYSFSTTGTGNVSISATPGIGSTDYDPVLFLFRDDGSLDTSDFIRFDDDAGAGLDALINEILNAGDYLVAVATHGADFDPLPIFGGHHSGTAYSLNISGDFVTGVAAEVPEPGSLALLSLGLVGLAAARKRKQA